MRNSLHKQPLEILIAGLACLHRISGIAVYLYQPITLIAAFLQVVDNRLNIYATST